MTDYSKKGHYYTREPRFELKHLLTLLQGTVQILDIGAGNGNNTKLLLERGYDVTAVEPNPEAIDILKLLQEQFPGKLHIVEASIDTFKPMQKFDVVICCMVIHFMKDHAAGIKAVRDVQSWTKSGGFNLVTSYMRDQSLSKEYSFLLEANELLGLYSKWKICWQQESFRLTWKRIYSLKDIPRLILGKRGFKAARLIAQQVNESSKSVH